MRSLVCGYLLLTLGVLAGERTVIINDEEGRRLAGAEVEAILAPAEDPRLSSVVVRAGVTDAAGRFRFETDDSLILNRVRAKQAGHFSADADHRHGLGRPAQSAELTLTLPRMTEGVPLHYREVRLTGVNDQDYVCLTDIARYKETIHTDDLIRNWLRNRNTLEFLGLWEQINNPGFNPVEFDGINFLKSRGPRPEPTKA